MDGEKYDVIIIIKRHYITIVVFCYSLIFLVRRPVSRQLVNFVF